ncbi:MAG: hypothetical protein HUU46_18100 [Candidatus Hydrogenedentes bacterium]|nr:hypothetical protein [Candidatus Hydrogenedentota bacterium]
MLLLALLSIFAAPELLRIPGQADTGCVEIHGVAAGEFDAAAWEAGALHFVPDVREPLLSPRQSGAFRNIYAPSAVETPGGWRVFYGAWDGVHTPNDRIYSTTTRDFIDFGPRDTVIEHGAFVHVCNVNALRNAVGSFEMMCTAYPAANNLNKPAYFTSTDGAVWNGSPAPHAATFDDLVVIEGYDGFAGADINGMNVILRDGNALWLYFNNFDERGKLFRATNAGEKRFAFEGAILDTSHYVNDVKRLDTASGPHYLMALHQNTGQLWYTLSADGKSFAPERVLADRRNEADRFIVAVCWVTQNNRVLGFLYGAGAVPELNRNRIFARWLQKRIVYADSHGRSHETLGALGPDRQIIRLPTDLKDDVGAVDLYAEDGATQIHSIERFKIEAGACYQLKW